MEELYDVFYYDEESPSCLSYGIEIRAGSRLVKAIGSHAGRVRAGKRGPDVQYNKKFYAASKVVWMFHHHEVIGKDEHLWRLDLNSHNVRIGNLVKIPITVARYLENYINAYKGHVTTVSGYLPCIQRRGKRFYFNNRKTPEEAHAAYVEALKQFIIEEGYGWLLNLYIKKDDIEQIH